MPSAHWALPFRARARREEAETSDLHVRDLAMA
jgi:hypothetical protein